MLSISGFLFKPKNRQKADRISWVSESFCGLSVLASPQLSPLWETIQLGLSTKHLFRSINPISGNPHIIYGVMISPFSLNQTSWNVKFIFKKRNSVVLVLYVHFIFAIVKKKIFFFLFLITTKHSRNKSWGTYRHFHLKCLCVWFFFFKGQNLGKDSDI